MAVSWPRCSRWHSNGGLTTDRGSGRRLGGIVGGSGASIVDLEMTPVVDGALAKVLAWYDNEWGFTCQMVWEALATLSVPRLI